MRWKTGEGSAIEVGKGKLRIWREETKSIGPVNPGLVPLGAQPKTIVLDSRSVCQIYLKFWSGRNLWICIVSFI